MNLYSDTSEVFEYEFNKEYQAVAEILKNEEISCTPCKINGYYPDPDDGLCKPCSSNCLHCSSREKCITCQPQYYLIESRYCELQENVSAIISLSDKPTIFILKFSQYWKAFIDDLLNQREHFSLVIEGIKRNLYSYSIEQQFE